MTNVKGHLLVADNLHKFAVVYYVADCFLTVRKF